MGGEMTRVTVLGAVVIAAVILIGLIVIQALNSHNQGDLNEQQR